MYIVDVGNAVEMLHGRKKEGLLPMIIIFPYNLEHSQNYLLLITIIYLFISYEYD